MGGGAAGVDSFATEGIEIGNVVARKGLQIAGIAKMIGEVEADFVGGKDPQRSLPVEVRVTSLSVVGGVGVDQHVAPRAVPIDCAGAARLHDAFPVGIVCVGVGAAGPGKL